MNIFYAYVVYLLQMLCLYFVYMLYIVFVVYLLQMLCTCMNVFCIYASMLYIFDIVVKVNGPFAASAVSGRFILLS